MAEGFSFEEAQGSGQPSASPGGGGFSFEEAVGGTSAPPTPQTDAALNETETLPQQLMRVARTPSPPWLRPFERSVRETATTPFLPSSAQLQGLRASIGLPDQPAAGSHLVETLYDPLTKFATLSNAALGAAYWAQPEIGALLTAGAIAPAVVPAAKKLTQLGQMTPEEGLQFGEEFWGLAAAPFIHSPEAAFKPVTPRFPDTFELQRSPEDVPKPPEEEVQTTMARPQKGPEVAPPETESDARAEARMLKARTRLKELGGDWQEVHKRMVAENGQNPTFPEFADELEDEIKDLEKQQGKEAAPAEAAAPESEEDAQNRYNEAYDRLAILHGHTGAADKAIDMAQGKSKTPLTMSQMADVLEAEREKIPEPYRSQSEDTGIAASRFHQAARIAHKLRQQFIDRVALARQRGVKTPETQAEFPNYKVEPLHGGGFKVTRLPRNVSSYEFVGATAKRQLVQKTEPGQDFFLAKEGGELQPYAERPGNAQVEKGPAPQREQTRPESEKPGTGRGDNVKRAPQGEAGAPGAQPKPTGERPVAPEPQAAPEPPQLVIEDLFDPKTKKRKGSIIKNQTTGEVVERFPSAQRNPDPNDLAATKQLAEERLAELTGKPKPEAPPKKKTFKTTVVFDEFGNSPETPVATAVTEMGGIKSKTAAKEQGKLEGNEAQWEDTAKLSHPTHNKIYDPNGEMPDVMAQNLHEAGLIDQPDVGAMNRELEKESAHVRAKTQEAEQTKGAKAQEKQATAFGKGQRAEQEEGGGTAIPVDSLNVGDTVSVDGTPLKVTEISPDDGTVTLEDGKRYGVQEVSGGDVIYGEVESTAPVEGAGEKIGIIGQKALNTADSDPAAARKIAFKRVGDHHVHQGTGLIVRYNKGKNLFEVVHPETGEVLGTGSTRRATLDAHLDGLFKKDAPPTTAEGEPEYDFSSIEGFEKAIKDRFKRDVTEEERKAFQPIVEQINSAKAAVQHEGAKAINKILDHFKGVKDIPFSEAVKKIQEAIDKATEPCDPF